VRNIVVVPKTKQTTQSKQEQKRRRDQKEERSGEEGEIEQLRLTNTIHRKLLDLQTTIEGLRRNKPAPSYEVLSTLTSAAEMLEQLVPPTEP
jgi:hypothetical protein